MILGRIASLVTLLGMIIFCAFAYHFATMPINQDWRNQQWVAANATKVVSESHVNDAVATTTIMDGNTRSIIGDGQADVLHAQACDIRNDCHAPYESTMNNVLLIAVVGIMGFCFIFAIVKRN